MWLFAEASGFVSAVVHRDDPSLLMIRARNRDHLERWFPAADIQHTPAADYAYRVTVPRESFAQLVADQVRGMKAENFKHESGEHFGHDSPYLHALHDVWATMWGYQR